MPGVRDGAVRAGLPDHAALHRLFVLGNDAAGVFHGVGVFPYQLHYHGIADGQSDGGQRYKHRIQSHALAVDGVHDLLRANDLAADEGVVLAEGFDFIEVPGTGDALQDRRRPARIVCLMPDPADS